MAASRAEVFARWSGVSVILFAALARLFTSPSRVPYWDIDPLTSWTPDTTRTPAMSLLLDALVWLATAMIVWGESRAGRGIAWRTGLLALIGCIGVFLHGWVLTPLVAIGGSPPTHGDFESLCLGSAWASAIIGGWALSMAARDSAARRFAAAMLLSAAVVLAAKGAMQVFVDHPRLVADFQQRKQELLAAQGFEPGSTAARLFERRLMQAEATGWFGLSNVYGSLMAASTAGLLAVAIGAMGKRTGGRAAGGTGRDGTGLKADQWHPSSREGTGLKADQWHPSGHGGLLWVATGLAGIGLALSQSKGAIAAGLVGCVCVVGARVVRGGVLRRAMRWAPVVLPMAVLAVVCVRGVLGERFGELSLFFRWQYLLGAGRIIMAHPLFGTGPAGFKDQYLLFKEPTNPEEIDSPHCLPMDWLATLGVLGAAWVVLWVVWMWRAGTGVVAEPAALSGSVVSRERDSDARSNPHHAPETGCVVAPIGVIAAVMGFSLWCEWAMYLPESLVVMLLAGAGWWLAVRSVIRSADEESITVALFGAAVVLGTHCMIEVTGVWASSAAVALALVALASSRGRDTRRTGVGSMTGPAIGACLIACIAALNAAGLARHDERALRRAAQEARFVHDSTGSGPRVSSLDRSIAELSGVMRMPVNEIRQRLRVLRALASFESGDRLELTEIISESALRVDIPAHADRPRAASAWLQAAQVLELGWARLGSDREGRAGARAWLKAAELDPHGLMPALRLARLYASLGEGVEAARWARRALEVNANLRLDPLKQLSGAERADMERIAGEG